MGRDDACIHMDLQRFSGGPEVAEHSAKGTLSLADLSMSPRTPPSISLVSWKDGQGPSKSPKALSRSVPQACNGTCAEAVVTGWHLPEREA